MSARIRCGTLRSHGICGLALRSATLPTTAASRKRSSVATTSTTCPAPLTGCSRQCRNSVASNKANTAHEMPMKPLNLDRTGCNGTARKALKLFTPGISCIVYTERVGGSSSVAAYHLPRAICRRGPVACLCGPRFDGRQVRFANLIDLFCYPKELASRCSRAASAKSKTSARYSSSLVGQMTSRQTEPLAQHELHTYWTEYLTIAANQTIALGQTVDGAAGSEDAMLQR